MPATIVEDEIRPPRVILFGQQFCALDGAELMGISASGPNCLQTMALRLLQNGYAPEHSLSLYRGGQHIGKVSLAAAANNANMETQE